MKIKPIRESTGMTQTELAEKLGVSQQAVSFWENGDRYPRTADLPRIADALGVTIDELLREKEGEERRTGRNTKIKSSKS